VSRSPRLRQQGIPGIGQSNPVHISATLPVPLAIKRTMLRIARFIYDAILARIDGTVNQKPLRGPGENPCNTRSNAGRHTIG
jgi:hypothetical protein